MSTNLSKERLLPSGHSPPGNNKPLQSMPGTNTWFARQAVHWDATSNGLRTIEGSIAGSTNNADDCWRTTFSLEGSMR